MRLSRIEIVNHSRVHDLDLRIRRHAVIVGANDVGKSSILRMLNLLLGTSTAGLYRELTTEDLRDPEQPLIINTWWKDFTDEIRRLFSSEISVDMDQVSESLWIQMRVELDPEDSETVTVQRWFPESGHKRAPSREQLEAFGWRYLRATRGSSMVEGKHSPIRTLLAAANLGTSEENLRRLLNQFNKELENNQSVGELLQRIANHLSRSMPRAISKDDFTIRTVTDPADDVLQNVTMLLNRDGSHISLMKQSDGVRQLMSMTLFDLAEGTANVLAIDEPEIHLHPTSQRTVADLLSGNGNQKIIVTHSPYILHRFDPSEIIAVNRYGECRQITTEKQLSNVEKARALWWSPRLLEALTAQFVILVEGDADRVIVEAVAEKLGIELDRLGAVVVELHGADKFKNVFPLLGPDGFGPTLLGLVDEEESGSWFNAFKGKRRTIVNRKIFISKVDLEDEYSRALGGPAVAEALISGELCREQGILQSTGTKKIEEISAEAAAKFCRGRKVEAATCVSEALTPEEAEKIDSVARLLHALDELSQQ
jgi:hypothetical protein